MGPLQKRVEMMDIGQMKLTCVHVSSMHTLYTYIMLYIYYMHACIISGHKLIRSLNKLSPLFIHVLYTKRLLPYFWVDKHSKTQPS